MCTEEGKFLSLMFIEDQNVNITVNANCKSDQGDCKPRDQKYSIIQCRRILKHFPEIFNLIIVLIQGNFLTRIATFFYAYSEIIFLFEISSLNKPIHEKNLNL